MQGPTPHVSRLRVADPEEIQGAIRGGDLEAMVLAGHRAETQLARVCLSGVCLDHAIVGPSMWFRGAMPSDCFTMAYVTACPGEGYSFNFNARHQSCCLGFYVPGATMEAITPAGYQQATLTIPKGLFWKAVEQHHPGWEGPLRINSRAVFPDEGTCQSLSSLLHATAEILREEPGSLADERVSQALEEDLRDHFLAMALGGADEPVAPAPRLRRRFQRLSRIREFVREHSHRRILLRELCAASGLSRRGLEYLFRDFLGMSAGVFLLRLRLHSVRRELVAAKPSHGLVKQSALNWGFWHLGRFAQEYHALFGERPSDTLARNRGP